MKVRESCYTGMLKDTPMKITKGMSRSDVAIPGVHQSYCALGMVKQLSESKQAHLNQMCANFIPQDGMNLLIAETSLLTLISPLFTAKTIINYNQS